MKNSYLNTNFYWFVLICSLLISCDLEEEPVDTANKSVVFGGESGLLLYTNSFYEWMPSANNIHQADAISDYGARRNVPDFLRGVYSSRTSDDTSASGYDLVALGDDWDWGWRELRNINYFLENNVSTDIPEEVKQHYNGLARFFRAWFYFEKVKRYGDVPWIDKPLDVDDPKLFEGRDPRTLVMDSVLTDINFAIENISPGDDPTRTLITKDVALALKSRIALFEGTFRKYHTDYGLSDTADVWLTEAAAAAQRVMESGNYSLYEGSGADESYRQLFISDSPVSSEIMLTVASDIDLGERHSANWYFTSSTTGIRFSFIRQFINTYLNLDGTPFTGNENYETMEFSEEMDGRDKRLEQTIRTEDYTRIDGGEKVPVAPNFNYTYTGYQPIKWTLDNVSIDGGSNNTNAVSVFRYAEILLNYAEAKAELGTITDGDWAATIGALRSRAGITNGLVALPTSIDPYMRSTYFPNIADPVIIEVRRERGIELALEGFRFYDIVRWKRGELTEMEWIGIYVPNANQLMDLNEDGASDVYFYTNEPPTDIAEGVTYVNVGSGSLRLENGNSGNIIWLSDIPRTWEEKNYLYPIPETHLLTNSNLEQNPGWE